MKSESNFSFPHNPRRKSLCCHAFVVVGAWRAWLWLETNPSSDIIPSPSSHLFIYSIWLILSDSQACHDSGGKRWTGDHMCWIIMRLPAFADLS